MKFEILMDIRLPNFEARSIFDENLVAIKLGQVQVLLNKLFYIGFCISIYPKLASTTSTITLCKKNSQMIVKFCTPTLII